MKNLFRIGIAGAAVALGLAMGLPAGGATTTPNPYSLTATGEALSISLGGNVITGGFSMAKATLDSTGGTASAQGKGILLTTSGIHSDTGLLTTHPGQAPAAAANTCAQAAPDNPLLALGLACTSGQVTEDATGDNALATATGNVADLKLLPIGGAPSPLPTGQITSALNTLLGPLASAAAQLPSPLNTIVTQVTNALTGQGGSLTALAEVKLGPSISTVTVNPSTATATTTNSGIEIDLLNGLGLVGTLPLLGDKPLIQIRVAVGDSTVTVCRVATTFNGKPCAAGDSFPTSNPSAAQVTLNLPVPGMPPSVINVGPGTCTPASLNVLLRLCLAGGSTTAGTGLGGSTASSDGLTLDLAPSQNAAHIALASSTTSAGGATGHVAVTTVAPPAITPAAAAVTPAPPAAATVPGVTAVHTGEPWAGPLPIAAVGLGMLGGLGLIARRRVAALAHRLTGFISPSASGPQPGPASGTSSVPPPVSGPARRLPKA